MPDNEIPQEQQDRLSAAVDLVGRTGAKDFQLRYSDDEEPVVWMAVAGYDNPKGNQARGTKMIWQAAGGLDPVRAAMSLLDSLIDGGKCTHCERPTGVSDDWDRMPLDELVCWYQYDPELKKFRRACE